MLIYTIGLPGSGKSVWAREYQLAHEESEVVLVSRDDIRLMLWPTHYEYEPGCEGLVTEIWTSAINHALYDGREVVVHDTNLNPSAVARLERIAGRNVPLQGVSFLHVSVDECIRRDALRTGRAQVGEQVIRKMADQWIVQRKGNREERKYCR